MDTLHIFNSLSTMPEIDTFERLIGIAHLEGIKLPLQILDFHKFFYLPEFDNCCALSAYRKNRFFTLTRNGRNVDIAEVLSTSGLYGVYQLRSCVRSHKFIEKDLKSTSLLLLNDRPLLFSQRLSTTALIHTYQESFK